MIHSRFAVATAAAAMTAALAPAAALADTIDTDKSFELQSNTTREIVVPIDGLGQAYNVLTPCFGFEVKGPGVDLAGANLETFGPAYPEDASLPDGGIPGAQRQPDGSFVIPESVAVLNAEVLRMGANCRSVGWDFYGADGEPQLDAYGNPLTSNTAKAKAASKRKRAAARKQMSRKIVGRAAQQGPVTVTLAGLRERTLVLRITTGQLIGTTTVSAHARVLRQN
ncbi:hypothetical protein [Solirubrobacter soli]|uniref:hypothetical protein n=1 Tax=Solirubrobacter soli TaxID=363832 RepID=UPI0003FE687A|nr:hypothetical protein [Solirubrobacter soli]